MNDHEYVRRRLHEDTLAKTLESPPPEGYGWSLVYRDGKRCPEEDRLVALHPQVGFTVPDEEGWRFGFGPKEAEFAWRCQRCRTVMMKNSRRCPACQFTVFDPVHRLNVEPKGTT